MSTTKILLYGALGVAAVLLLTSERARNIRVDLENKTRDNADKWKDKLKSIGSSAGNTLSELRDLLSTEMEGLSDDARQKIENVLNGTAKSANGLKRNVRNQLT